MTHVLWSSLALFLLTLATPQETPAPPSDAPAPETAPASSASANQLRERIRGMRMSLLTGGERVRAAEEEAVAFYRRKAELVDQRLDTVHTELTEKRASYDLALERALSGGDAEARQGAMREAARLRSEVSALEREQTDLREKRESLDELASAVAERDRERERLVTQLETSSSFDAAGRLPLAGIGLAPVTGPEVRSPLEDEGLVEDLLRIDPEGARRLLFESSPAAYWRRFPLRPPVGPLREALSFPMPDLPGRR